MTDRRETEPSRPEVERYDVIGGLVGLDGVPVELTSTHHDERLNLGIEAVSPAIHLATHLDPRWNLQTVDGAVRRQDLRNATHFLRLVWPWAELVYEVAGGVEYRPSTHVVVLSQRAEPPPEPPFWPPEASNILVWVSRSDDSSPWRCHWVARRGDRNRQLQQRRREIANRQVAGHVIVRR